MTYFFVFLAGIMIGSTTGVAVMAIVQINRKE
jgi:hypothetical protein